VGFAILPTRGVTQVHRPHIYGTRAAQLNELGRHYTDSGEGVARRLTQLRSPVPAIVPAWLVELRKLG
jgi:hypothetical protein